MKIKKLTMGQAAGIFEGDGGWLFRFTKTSKKSTKITFKILMKVGQKAENREVVDQFAATFGFQDKVPENKPHIWIEFPLNREDGKRAISLYDNRRVLNPGCLNDYLLAKLMQSISDKEPLKLPAPLLSQFNQKDKKQQDRCKQIIQILLRDKRGGSNVQAESKDSLLQYSQATPSEIEEASKYAEALYEPITIEVQKLVFDLNNDLVTIDYDYLMHYHAADGCFSFGLDIREGVTVKYIKLSPFWSLTDDKKAEPLLRAICRQNKILGTVKESGGAQILIANGWEAVESVIPLFENQPLPKMRQDIFNTFKKLVLQYKTEDYLKDAKTFETFIEEAYFLNETNSVRNREKFNKKFGQAIKDFINNGLKKTK